jgi:hypothetical protein
MKRVSRSTTYVRGLRFTVLPPVCSPGAEAIEEEQPADEWPPLGTELVMYPDGEDIAQVKYRVQRSHGVIEMTVLPAPGQITRLSPNPEATVKWYTLRIQAWPQDRPAPTIDQDLADARKQFGERVTLRHIRKLRAAMKAKGKLPPDWSKRGPRGPRTRNS